jgi:TonB family protein
VKLKYLSVFCATLVCCCAFAQRPYQPPIVASAGDAYIPYQIVIDGLFVLDVHISGSGKIQQIDPLRNPGSMLDAAETSVRNWKFQPASEGGEHADSRMTASFVYRPPNGASTQPVPPRNFAPVLPAADSIGYIPVGILSFAYPDYPANSVAWGSVVVEATVDSTGAIAQVRVLHRTSGFDTLALDALKKWRFRPASLRGKPVAADTVVAFVFQTPTPAY